MYTGRMVFSQLMDFLPSYEFGKCVRRYQGDHRIRSFNCLDQFLCMAFAQLTYRESLRDIEACLRVVPSKLYHLGFRGGIARNTLANANENRDLRIKAFFGTSENAVKTQVWIAISVYVLVAIIKKELGLNQSLYAILQVLNVTLFEKTHILQAFADTGDTSPISDFRKQLALFDL